MSIGNSGWSGQTEKLNVHGSSYFIDLPALSGFSIKNYAWSPSFDFTSIIPQWNNACLIGTSSHRFFEAHVANFYGWLYWVSSDNNLKTNIKPITSESALNAIKLLNAYTYDFKPDAFKNSAKELKEC